MAAEVLITYVAHDAHHDLESAVWLLLCTVLRHTLQIYSGTGKECERYSLYLANFDATAERSSCAKKILFLNNAIEWEVKDNKPLTKLITDLWVLTYKQNQNPVLNGPRIPLTYKSVLTAFNRALASSDWPVSDAALPFTLPRDGNSSGNKGKKRVREDEVEENDEGDDAAASTGSSHAQRAAKRPMVGPSPLRNEVGGNPFDEDSDDD